MTDLKTCTTCRQEKTVEEFYLIKSANPPRREAKCKVCRSNRQIEVAKKNKESNITPDLSGTKFCVNCEQEKPKDEFPISRRNKSGVASSCKLCLRGQYRTLDGQASYRMSSSKSRAAEMGKGFNLDKEFLDELWKKQDGKCAITGVTIDPSAVGELNKPGPYTFSIDRIDSSIGYTKDNVQLTCSAANRLKNIWSNDLAAETLLTYLKHQGYTLTKGTV